MTASDVEKQVRAVVARYAKLGVDATTIDRNGDLYRAGMTSHASVSLMLGLENEFDVEFPDRMLKRSLFENISSICEAVQELVRDAAA